MASQTSILGFGGSGVIGRYIVDAILESGKFSLSIFTSPDSLSEKSDAFEKLKSRGAKIIVGDVRNEQDVKAAYKGIDIVVSAVGRPVIDDQINLIKWAEETPNVTWFFPSEYGTDIEYGPQSASEKPHQLKLKVRKFIKDNVKRLSYTYLVTGPYADMYFNRDPGDDRTGGYDVNRKSAVIIGDGNNKVSLTTMDDTGKLLVAALDHPKESHNAALKVNSFTATPLEILAEFERQTGGEKWKVSHISVDDTKRNEAEAWEKKLPIATSFTLRRIWAEGGTLYAQRDNEMIGCTDLDTLETAVRRAITAQTGGK